MMQAVQAVQAQPAAQGQTSAAEPRRAFILMSAIALAGCATRTARQGPEHWSGRLSMQVGSNPPQAFSAGFELSGNSSQGQLLLNSPLGTAVASAQWTAEQAVLRSGSDARHYRSMEELLTHATGAALPLAALFDWLTGVPTPVAGWDTDLSGLNQGRLLASRQNPEPTVQLRILLDR
jgi:outer membrane lipoprotein LolB